VVLNLHSGAWGDRPRPLLKPADAYGPWLTLGDEGLHFFSKGGVQLLWEVLRSWAKDPAKSARFQGRS